MVVKFVIVLGVVLVVLFIASVCMNSSHNKPVQNNGPDGTDAQTTNIQQRFDGLLSRPLDSSEIRDPSGCLAQSTGCRFQTAHQFQVVQSDDRIRNVRRATLALLPTSTTGAMLAASFQPVQDDPANGKLQSKSTPVPAATPRPGQPPPERARAQFNISRDGGTVTLTCGPPTAICVVKLVEE